MSEKISTLIRNYCEYYDVQDKRDVSGPFKIDNRPTLELKRKYRKLSNNSKEKINLIKQLKEARKDLILSKKIKLTK